MKTKATKALAVLAMVQLGLALLTACSSNGDSGGSTAEESGAQEAVTLKVGLFGALSDAGLIVAQEKGYFEDENITVEFTPSQSAPTIMGLVASGQLDAAGTAPSPGLFNALATNVGLKIAADKGRIDPDHSWTGLVVHSDSGISSVADLKGKKIALPDINTSTGGQLNRALEEAGLTLDDVTLVPGSAADNFSAFKGGAVDAAALQEPFIANALSGGDAEVLSPFGEVMPNAQNGILLFGEKLSGDKALSKRFLDAYLKGVADYSAAFPVSGDPVGRDEVVQALIANTPVKDAALYEKMQPVLFDPTGSVDTDSVDYFQDFFISIGTQNEKIQSSDYLLDLGQP